MVRKNMLNLPIAIGVIGSLVLLTNFMALKHFGDDYNLHGGIDSFKTAGDTGGSAASSIPETKLASALAKTPVGNLGPANTTRQRYRYYDTLFYTTLQFGADAASIIEVGCASDPFIKYLAWADKRTCVAPYFVKYSEGGTENKELGKDAHVIDSVVADFMEYEVDDYSYDLLVCSQVVEHVPDPSAFVKKLIRTAKTSIISVPFKWPHCGESCNHVTDEISYSLLLEWSKPHKPVYSSIVREKGKGDTKKRIIMVFQPE